MTGAGGGIGAAITGAFLLAGADVVATDANADALTRALGKIEGGDRVVTLAMDVTSEADIRRVFDIVAERFGKLDVLVNNAGIKSAEKLLSGDPVRIERTMKINSDAVLLCSKLIVDRFMREAGGRIVNIGSSLSSQGAVFNYQAGGADYCFSKAVVHDLTKLLAYECAPLGINVNGVAPGIIDTPMHGRTREKRRRVTPDAFLSAAWERRKTSRGWPFSRLPGCRLHYRADRSHKRRDVDEWLIK